MDSICLGTHSCCLDKWSFRDELFGWHATLVFPPAIGGLVLLNLQSSTSWPGFWKLLTVCFYLCLLVSLGSFILCYNRFLFFLLHMFPWWGHIRSARMRPAVSEKLCVWCHCERWAWGWSLLTRSPPIIKPCCGLSLTLGNLVESPCNLLGYFEPVELIQRDLSLMSVA